MDFVNLIDTSDYTLSPLATMTTLKFNTDEDIPKLCKDKSWLATFKTISAKKDIIPVGLTYKQYNCFVNAYFNKTIAYKDFNLKYVIGALAFNQYPEFGNKNWNKEKYLSTSSVNPFKIDAHAWLEDTDGNIYDYCFANYSLIAYTRTNKPLKYSGLIEKKSKAECEALGLTYTPADKETQLAIFLLFNAWKNSAKEASTISKKK